MDIVTTGAQPKPLVQGHVLAYAVFAAIAFVFLFYERHDVIAHIERSGLSPDGKVAWPTLLLLKLAILLFLPLPLLAFGHVFWRDFKASPWISQRIEVVAIAAVIVLQVCSMVFGELRSLFMGEQAPLEILTAVLAAASAVVLLFYCAPRLARPISRVLVVLAGLAFLLFALEEISYGQHLMKFQVSDYFMAKNAQLESNIHNLGTVQRLIHGPVPFVACLAIALYFLMVARGFRPFPPELAPAVYPDNAALYAYVFLGLTITSSYAGGEPHEEVVSIMMLFAAARLAYALSRKHAAVRAAQAR